MIPSESERGRSDSEARTETCDAVSDLLPTPALPVAPTPLRHGTRSVLHSSLLFCSPPDRHGVDKPALNIYCLQPTVRRVSSETAYFRPFCHHH